METLNGKKSYIGVLLYAIGDALVMAGYPEYGEPVKRLGEMLFGVGVAHKLAKLNEVTNGQDEKQGQG
jgi:hypothetical protein